MWLRVLFDDLEWEEFDVVLHGCVRPLATDQTLGVENGVLGIGGELILGCISDETFALSCECNV